MPPIITLLTDFGGRDPFVGVMKGVILTRWPAARLVDLTHEIAPGDIAAGALALRWAVEHFPPGTVHLAVVDPGVGSARRPLVLTTPTAIYVGPDNGLLWPAAARAGEPEVWEIDLSCWDRPVSATFHGRDVFAPAAARLAAGEPPKAFCRSAGDAVCWAWPAPERWGDGVHGVVVYVDRFGNGITNLSPATLDGPGFSERRFHVAGREIAGPSPAYSAVPEGAPLIVLGSTGLYEIAVNRGNAAESLGLQVGSPLLVEWESPVSAR